MPKHNYQNTRKIVLSGGGLTSPIPLGTAYAQTISFVFLRAFIPIDTSILYCNVTKTETWKRRLTVYKCKIMYTRSNYTHYFIVTRCLAIDPCLVCIRNVQQRQGIDKESFVIHSGRLVNGPPI